MEKYSGSNARICLLRLLDTPDDHVRRALLGDLIVSWVPGQRDGEKMSMVDMQLTSVVSVVKNERNRIVCATLFFCGMLQCMTHVRTRNAFFFG